ncbi:MAG: sulfatase-like hydrolase/transferase, partial [Phycisphaeraceae bacterium]|nr:sulfatase-like hydrolase/transferase [Phycisphaeraceae bacterium]
LISGDRTEVIKEIKGTDNLEYEVSKRIKLLTTPEEAKHKVGFVQGFGGPADSPQFVQSINGAFTQIYGDLITATAVKPGEADIPAEVDALVILNPAQPVSEAAKFRIDQFLMEGKGVAWLQTMKGGEDWLAYSLFASRFHKSLVDRKLAPHIPNFPLGLPGTHFDEHFILEDGVDFVVDRVRTADDPYLGYFHFLPPHHPYHTRVDHFQRFHRDGYILPDKPEHTFTQGVGYEHLDEQSTWYDEFILYVDAEFARLYQALQETGALDNTWIFLTSDHGEMFERGIRRHNTPTLFQPVIHVPLMIFPPGQDGREDVFTTTSSADLLPTMLQISGKSQLIDGWMEGRVLPPFEGVGVENGDVFTMEAKKVRPNAPMEPGTVAGFRGDLKLIYYFGYPELGEGGERIELFDLRSDPCELHDLYPANPELGSDLLDTIKAQIRSRDAAVR